MGVEPSEGPSTLSAASVGGNYNAVTGGWRRSGHVIANNLGSHL